MIIKLVFFARARELAGESCATMQLREHATVGELKIKLSEKFPELAPILKHCAIAVDQEYAADSHELRDGCEVGCIPPVSGG